ncbi:unnamed protein product [Microthlaspi erraticum]|uniref:Uncharacterized protein n=1 Tax=Microthlaspi erraticum TaxID=1685480 RepID=A0A6D2I3K1_9BRAS|nr:unnamed protein product [Microthlaspi erraticum]
MYSLIIHGRRLVDLQKCRNLRALVNPFQNVFALSNSFSSVSATAAAEISLRDGRKEKTFTVSYLVDSLGLTTKLAESISRKVSFQEKVNPDSVLRLLRSHGFTDPQISTIITSYPGLLIVDAEKSLAPKLKFLQSRGTLRSELTEVLTKVPKILAMKKDKATSVYYDFVKEIIKADKSSKFETLCHPSLTQGSPQENIIRNVLALRELGVPQKLFLPLLISRDQPVCGKERFEESLKKVVEMGFDPSSSRFVEALRVVQRVSKKAIEEKVQVYERLGFGVDDVWAMFKKWPLSLALSEKNISSSMETFLGLGFSRDEFTMMVKSQPQCIGYSSEMVKKKTEFLVKEMNWPLKAVVSTPAVLGYSLEKRTVPRCNVIQALMAKGLLGSKLPPMSFVLAIKNEAFLDKYVRKHVDKELVADLMGIFTAKTSKKQSS